MSARHEGSDLLVGGADVAKVLLFPLRSLERTVEPSDAITGVAVELVQIPRDEAVDDEVADRDRQSTTSPERSVLGSGTSETTAVVADRT